jgi:hypothetical protein
VEEDIAEGDSSEAVFCSEWTKSGAFSRRCLRADDRRFGIFKLLNTLVGKDALSFRCQAICFYGRMYNVETLIETLLLLFCMM